MRPPAYVEERYPAVPIGALVNAFGRQDDEVTRLLGPEGPIARGLPGYQPRPSQMAFAQAVARSLKQKKALVAEAGTGTGKSIGYLAPAIAWATEHRKTVVVATATLALQDQLRMKDLPFLQSYLDIDFTWSIQKGRTNYACLERLSYGTPPLEHPEEWAQVEAWLDRPATPENPKTGDIGELKFDLKRADLYRLREFVTTDEDDCTGTKCDFLNSCYFYRARNLAKSAQVVVVNHALLALDLVLGGQLLPRYDAVIVDEAHQFEGYVRSASEVQISMGRFRTTFRRVERLLGDSVDENLMGESDQATRDFFDAAGAFVRERLRGAGRIRLDDDKPANVMQAAGTLADILYQVESSIERWSVGLGAVDADQGYLSAEDRKVLALQAKAANLTRGLDDLRQSLAGLVKPAPANICSWAEVGADPAFPPTFYGTPISVAPFLRERLWGKGLPVVLCSATLATSRDEHAFDLVREALGLDHPLTMQVDSPYDYASQALWYLPEICPSVLERRPGEDYQAQTARHVDALMPHLHEVLTATRGRAFLLFTSYQVLREVRRRLDVPWPVKTQEDGSKGALVEWFKTTAHPVLLGTASFWEGVDIPGRQLSCVVIDKIPFTSPSDPVEKAIQDLLGRQAFWKRNLPHAVMMLKQGVGRLIRTETDRGLVVLLDPRFRTKGYGRDILAALPGSPEPDVTTLNPDCLPLVGGFIDGLYRVA